MAISKTEKGWLVDSQPGGRGSKRYRKTLSTKGEALAFEAWLKTKTTAAPEWSPAKRDLRKLSELVDIWYQHHGVNLKAGEDTYSRLKTLCIALGNPFLDRFTGGMFAEYRKNRTLAGIAPNTLHREHAYMRSVINEAKRLGHWKGENPLSSVRQIKVPERELSFLSKDDIKLLLKASESSRSEDTLLIAKVCLSTGARWSEAEQLRPSQVKNGQIQFSNTKSGKNRSIPISPSLQTELEKKMQKREGFDRLFIYSYIAFRKGIERAGLLLPPGQLTHVLRHSFASHFMMNGGNILVLPKFLGHSSLTMTMRYPHLSPDHLQEARQLNPLNNLD